MTSREIEAAADRLMTAAAGARLPAVEALLALGVDDPDARQEIVDAVCAWFQSDDPGSDDPGSDERRAALRLLADRLDGDDPWEEIGLDLSGATLVDADLSGCRLDGSTFADARFLGTTAFDGATFDDDTAFHRAVFHGDATFTRARFDGDAEFGRTRFRGRADFSGAAFAGAAWFGRGAHTWWDDDEDWDTVEEIVPAPWDELNEDDPEWPVAVLIEDYQDWEEGGDGARFAGDVSFRDARFDGPAWFYYARFGATATFAGAWFAGRTHLDQPAVDLAGARWGGDTDDGETVWPLGWTTDLSGDVVPDASVLPYARQPLPDGLAVLDRLGDDRPELRQRILVTMCAFLRVPVPFDLRATARTPAQEDLLRVRRDVQRTIAARLRPGDRFWPDMNLWLCGATLVDLDFSGCQAGYVDFDGAQFHGTTRFDGSRLDRISFTESGRSGHATFHGDVVFATGRPEHVVVHGSVS
ncbi:hypothetical protein GCM10009557_68090 [Virgisporangium ochraceum]